MKIAVIGILHNPIKPPFLGGLESFTYNIISSYLEKGYQVDFYGHKESANELNCCFNGFAPTSDLDEDMQYLNIMRKISQSHYDVIHNNTMSPIPLVYSMVNNLKIITTLHTPPYTKLKAALLTIGNYKYSKFIAPSKYIKNLWQDYTRCSIEVIHNGINIGFWNSKWKSKVPRSAFWSGRINYQKGLDLSIKTAIAAEIPLSIVGPIGDKDYFDTAITPLLGGSIKYLGHLQHKEMRDIYRESSVSLHSPRWNEPFGLTTVESLASGTPAVGFSSGAFSEIVTEKSGVVAKRKCVKSLVNAIEDVSTLSPEIVSSESKRFDISIMTSKYCEKMRELC